MDADRFTRLRDVVDRALARPAETREAFVRETCADDPDLVREALNLLDQDSRSGAEFTGELEDQVRRAAGRALAEDPVPEVIGDYRITDKLGEGGMGVVYRAEQTGALERAVALKLIRAGWNSRRVVARFESERLTLGRMAHPNIARVFDAGTTDDNRPWFAMEMVEGPALTTWCDENRRTTRERLELFLDVCRGVEHAHQRGIIHRDLKPSNVLVSDSSGAPVPKIIDFGIAKALSDQPAGVPAMTLSGQKLGSPDYMSPEHLDGEGDLDIRSDVYSLGVLLYELLSGRLPFARATSLGSRSGSGPASPTRDEPPSLGATGSDPETRTAEVAARRQTSPRRLRRALRGELDWIVGKALAPDREHRYATTRSLMEDLERHLAGEPVLAGRPPLSYRLGKFMRRYRVPVTVALVVIAALAVGLAESQRQRQRAEVARSEALTVTDFLSDMLSSVEPDQEGRDVTVRQVLDEAADETAAEFAAQPLVRARLQLTIGRAYHALGENEAAIGQLEAALAVRREELGADDPATLEVMAALGSAVSHDAQFARAAGLYRAALDGLRRRPEGRVDEICNAMNGLANALADQGLTDESEPYYVEALALSREHLGEQDPQTTSLLNNLALLRADQGRMEECRDLLAEVLTARRQAHGDGNTRTMETVINLASAESQLGNLDAAIAALAPLVPQARKAVGENHRITLAAMNNLAWAYAHDGQLDAAGRMTEETLAIRQDHLGPDHPETLITAFNLADLRFRQGRPAEAEQLHREVLATRVRVMGADHPHTRLSVEEFAKFLRETGRDAMADSLLAAHP